MSKRAYRATRVNDVNWDQLAQGKDGLDITLGVDVGKYSLWAVCRWADGRFERPWRVQNPGEIPTLLTLLKGVSAGRRLVVAMESSGTYGDALRQALADNQIELQRVGGKAAHDYAEAFDGVPSQHDGKDAAVGGRAGGLGQGHAMGVPASRSLGAGTDVLGGVDGGPPADADDLAGAIGGALGASLAGSDSGAETFLGDAAAGLETLWDSPGIGCGRGSCQALGPLGWGVPGAGKDRATANRCGCKRRGSSWGVATASDPELRPAGLGSTARSQSSGTAVAQLGRGTCGAPSPREGGGCANGVCLVGEHGRPAEVSCSWCVPQSDGLEPGGTQQRDLPRAVADQQAR